MTTNKLLPALIIPFIAWRIYVRARRHIGRQPFRPGRLKASIVILSLVTAGLAIAGAGHPAALGGVIGGLVISIPLALWGISLTKFEDTPAGKFYTPNTALGLAVTALFIGRLAYRFLVIGVAPGLQAPMAPQPFQSPLTFFLFGLTAGYYITYSAGVLIRSHQVTQA